MLGTSVRVNGVIRARLLRRAIRTVIRTTTIYGLFLLLQACGGSNNTGPALVNLSISAGPSAKSTLAGYQHIWVTVKGLAYTTVGSEPYSPTDPNWTVITLPNALTVDLANLDQGAMQVLFSNLNLGAGNYPQMRLLLAATNTNQTQEISGSTAPLLENSAQTLLDSNGQALQWNNQVEYLNQGKIYEAPLEVPLPQMGMLVASLQSLGNGVTYWYDLDLDLDHALISFSQPNTTGGYGFALTPQLYLHNLQLSGAIHGQLDASKLCQPGAVTTSCASQVEAMAEIMRIDANLNVTYTVERATAVNPVDGTFDLYPLDSSAINGQNYQVVVTGKGMQTIVINNVPVNEGSTSATTYYGGTQGTLSGNIPVDLSPSVLPVTLTTSPDFAPQQTASVASVSPYGSNAGALIFAQMPVGYANPLEIRWVNTDPFTGLLPPWASSLPLNSEPINQANYAYGAVPVLTAAAPIEGAGSYSVLNNGAVYETPSTLSASPIISASKPSFSPATPLSLTTTPTAKLTINFTVTNKQAFDRGQLVLTDLAGIVQTVDLTNVLSGSITQEQISVPTGTSAVQAPGALYYPYLRLWHSTSSAVPTLEAVSNTVDMRYGGAQTATVNIP